MNALHDDLSDSIFALSKVEDAGILHFDIEPSPAETLTGARWRPL